MAAIIKPSIPKGTRDFIPQEVARRNYIFQTLRSIFEKYAYLPIETPVMENLSTLTGKYGEEGDKLLFKILNSGDFKKGVDLNEENTAILGCKICEKGLRYDLTVPFARFVVQHRNDLTFPFKRYQMQPVWRADRPQKGRYREFYQCDVDVIGSPSLLNEVELIQITYEAFQKLKIPIDLKLNNRKILSGLAEVLNQADKLTDICVAIDKLDKIGAEKVCQELMQKEIPEATTLKIAEFFNFVGNNDEKLTYLKSFLQDSELGMRGVTELETTLDYVTSLGLTPPTIDISLARGLNYYTGAIFEVKALNMEMGSIAGGGRYDDLTGMFGLKDMSGVGISFGAERIYDVLLENDLYPESITNATQVMIVNFGQAEERYALQAAKALRQEGIATELYPDKAKIAKQMNYANAKNIPFVVMAGENEMAQQQYTLKNMTTGEQQLVNLSLLIDLLQ